MASFIAPLIPWSFAITFVSLTAALWSRRINAVVLEPYLVSLIPRGPEFYYSNASRMKSFILGKHKPIFAVNGASGTLN